MANWIELNYWKLKLGYFLLYPNFLTSYLSIILCIVQKFAYFCSYFQLLSTVEDCDIPYFRDYWLPTTNYQQLPTLSHLTPQPLTSYSSLLTSHLYRLPTNLQFPFYNQRKIIGCLLAIDWASRGLGPNQHPTNPQPTPNQFPIKIIRFQEKNRIYLVNIMELSIHFPIFRKIETECWNFYPVIVLVDFNWHIGSWMRETEQEICG